MTGHYFKRLRYGRPIRAADLPPTYDSLASLLARRVVERFAHIGDGQVMAIPLTVRGPGEADDPPRCPGHPACAEFAGTDYCRESWLLHLAELREQPETHWHKCAHDRLCAFVPLIVNDQCLAVLKLAGPASRPKKDFEQQVELLDTLVRGFAISEAEFLHRLYRAERIAAELGAPPSPGKSEPVKRPSTHPQVRKAIQYIDQHLSDPKLTVATVARRVGVHPNYLSHLFVDQVGQRMSEFIAGRRMERAKTLLDNTDWQIKRIADETGYANSNWFCYVFRTFTGLTPGKFRKRARPPAERPPSIGPGGSRRYAHPPAPSNKTP
jgi:AraC-like DNA-binding protein